jgi:hypothetical protein
LREPAARSIFRPMLGAHNVIRILITLFVAILVVVSALGWVWVGTHLSSALALAARVVLAAGMIAAGAALSMLWRWSPSDGGPAHRPPS